MNRGKKHRRTPFLCTQIILVWQNRNATWFIVVNSFINQFVMPAGGLLWHRPLILNTIQFAKYKQFKKGNNFFIKPRCSYGYIYFLFIILTLFNSISIFSTKSVFSILNKSLWLYWFFNAHKTFKNGCGPKLAKDSFSLNDFFFSWEKCSFKQWIAQTCWPLPHF